MKLAFNKEEMISDYRCEPPRLTQHSEVCLLLGVVGFETIPPLPFSPPFSYLAEGILCLSDS